MLTFNTVLFGFHHANINLFTLPKLQDSKQNLQNSQD